MLSVQKTYWDTGEERRKNKEGKEGRQTHEKIRKVTTGL
jgi:hypothetical protein